MEVSEGLQDRAASEGPDKFPDSEGSLERQDPKWGSGEINFPLP